MRRKLSTREKEGKETRSRTHSFTFLTERTEKPQIQVLAEKQPGLMGHTERSSCRHWDKAEAREGLEWKPGSLVGRGGAVCDHLSSSPGSAMQREAGLQGAAGGREEQI